MASGVKCVEFNPTIPLAPIGKRLSYPKNFWTSRLMAAVELLIFAVCLPNFFKIVGKSRFIVSRVTATSLVYANILDKNRNTKNQE